jgi:peptide/nickel transport system substrate-binding protein
VASVRSGAVHFAVGLGEPEVVAELRQDSGLEVTARQGPVVEHLELRLAAGGHPALRNKLVRRALAYGIDRAAIVRELYGEVDPKLQLLDSMAFPTHSPAYSPNWRRYRQTPALARRLLEQAGCRRGADDIYVCGDRRLSLRFVTSAGVPVRARVLSMVQTQLRQVGIEAVPDFASRAVLFGQIIPSGEFDVALFSWISAPESSGLKDIFGCQAIQNYMGYCQRLVTQELDQVNRILDSGRRAEALNRADRMLAEDVPVIPLYQFVELAARRTTLRGVVHTPANALSGAEDWWLAR